MTGGGAHPDDARRFARHQHERLREACAQLAWLLSRGYAAPSSLKLVGDRFTLDARQRSALLRSTCSDATCARRAAHRVEPATLAGATLRIDGFNVLTTIETALAGGVLLRGRDGALRDVAGVHGTWRRKTTTSPALGIVQQQLDTWRVARAVWLLDAPVSNSGRLRAAIRDVAPASEVEVVPDPDPLLAAARDPIATSDGEILDRCAAWVDLAGAALATARTPLPLLVDFRS